MLCFRMRRLFDRVSEPGVSFATYILSVCSGQATEGRRQGQSTATIGGYLVELENVAEPRDI